MVTVIYNDNLSEVENDISADLELIFASAYGSQTATSFGLTDTFDALVFSGSGFGTYVDGRPTTGVITGFQAYDLEHGAPILNYTLAGLSLNVSDFNNYVISRDGIGLRNAIYGGSDAIAGGDNDDYLVGYGGIDNIYGGGGNDTIQANAGLPGESYDGGAGFDTLEVTVGDGAIPAGVAADFRNATIASIEHLAFSYDNTSITAAAFSTTQFGGSGLASNLLVSGNGFSNLLAFFMPGPGAVDLSGLTFVDWTPALNQDRVAVNGSDGADSVIGTVLSDLILGDTGGSGGGAADTIHGNGGDDFLDGNFGADQVYGDGGNDTIRITQGQNVAGELADGGSGTDILLVNGVVDLRTTTLAGFERLTLANAAGSASVYFSNTQIASAFTSNVVVSGSTGIDYIAITGGSVDLSGWTFNSWTASGSAGDFIGIRGSNGADVLTGSATNDSIQGDTSPGSAGSADTIHGGGGDDVLDGWGGADQVYGDEGNDQIDIWTGEFAAGERADGGTGTDTLALFGTLNLGGGIFNSFERLLLGDEAGGPGATAVVTIGIDQLTAGFSSNLALVGSAERYTLIVAGPSTPTIDLSAWTFSDWNAANVIRLQGGSGDQTLIGTSQKDFLAGAGGDDILNGGGGIDAADYSGAGSAVSVNLGITTAQNTVGAGVDTLSNIENLIGSAFDDSLIGDAGDNVLNGGGGNDTLRGGLGNDAVSGNEGNDILFGGEGNDILDGGAGVDTAEYSTAGSYVTINLGLTTAQDTHGVGFDTLSLIENLNGSAYDDSLIGDGGDNLLNGAGGNDTLRGGLGNDTVNGGEGNDILFGGEGNDTLDGGNGVDTADYSTAGSYVTINLGLTIAQDTHGVGIDTLRFVENLNGSAYDDSLIGDGGDNVLNGAGGNDTLRGGLGNDTVNGGEGNDTLFGGEGNDTLDGGNGFDTADYSTAGSYVTINLGLTTAQDTHGVGIDTLRFVENLNGSAYEDSLIGDSGDNILNGAGGNDILRGGLGNDTVNGDEGADTLFGGEGNDTLDGGAGVDTADYSAAGSYVTVDLNLTMAQDTHGVGIDTLRFIENLNGSAYEDSLTGDGGDNVLNGAGGSDILTGNGGNDTLDGGDGSDRLDGGAGIDALFGRAGNDTLATVASQVGAGDIFDGGADIDTLLVYGGGSTNARFDQATVTGIEKLTFGGGGFVGAFFTAAQAGSSLASNLAITGSAQAETIFVSGGSINLSAWTFTNWNNLTDGVRIVGSAGGDTLTGSTQNDIISGTTGTDTIHGGLGNDYLLGGVGADQVFGDDGDDTFDITFGDGMVAGNDGSVVGDLMDGGAGVDLLLIAGSVDLTGATITNFEKIQLDDVTYGGTPSRGAVTVTGAQIISGFAANTQMIGSAQAYTLTINNSGSGALNLSGWTFSSWNSANTIVILGGAGADTITGTSQNDKITGGAGDDVLNGGGGVDTADYSSADSAIAVNLGVTTAQNSGGAGVDTLSNIENLIGSAFDDSLIGDAGDNVLSGGLGNDTLRGGLGNDAVNGDDGNDILFGGEGNDLLDGGAGVDTADYSTAGSYVTINLGLTTAQDTHGVGIDTLRFIENLNGSAFDDSLIGDTGDNVLNGANGNDTLRGGLGNDTVNGGEGNDTLFGGEGNDTLDGGNGVDTADYSTAGSYVTINLGLTTAQDTHGVGIDTLRFVENLNGSAFDDSLIGDTGDNVLNGANGNDTLRGGLGNDTVNGGEGNDILFGGEGNDILDGGAGVDTADYSTAGSYVTIDLNQTTAQDTHSVGIDTLRFVENLNGSAYNDILIGNGVANTLNGGAGADVLTGGAGNDTFLFSSTAHTAWNLADRITDFSAGDVIDLHLIDANTTADDDQAFHIATAANEIGGIYITYDSGANQTTLRLDTNSDGTPDAMILLNGDHHDLNNADFVL